MARVILSRCFIWPRNPPVVVNSWPAWAWISALLDIDIPEQRGSGEAPDDYVRRVAREKAGAGLLDVLGNPSACVLGSDTEVVLDDEVFGKPGDADEAAAMLRRLSGRTHRVLSAVSLVSPAREAQALCESRVTFAPLDDATIAGYLASGEWQGKAGAYAIQGIAEVFVERLDGSFSGVMGLPLHDTARLLAGFGVPVLQRARTPDRT